MHLIIHLYEIVADYLVVLQDFMLKYITSCLINWNEETFQILKGKCNSKLEKVLEVAKWKH